MADSEKDWIESGPENERAVFFSDAVFAIAITLLAVDVRLPAIPPGEVAERLPGVLIGLLPRFYSFAISFWIIAAFWLAHHRLFRYIKGYDPRLLRINFLFLMWIVLMPFSATLLGEYASHQLPLVIYFSNMILANLSLYLLWWYAARDRKLVDADLDSVIIRHNGFRSLGTLAVFLLAIVISFFSASAAGWSVLLLVFVRPATILYARLQRTS